ncbi:MAG: tRNA (adenosine(37)-N6)-threonylcarbamoyltransferase complex dimerization subunit type 1 TsaB [Acidobacteriota bacterium]|jgi:tRNA threonylcarbamoyladenosine biosynthesis protein TsaB
MPESLAPKILAFDTSSVRGSIALLEGTETRAELRLHSLQTHSALLLSSIDFLLGRIAWKLSDINLVAAGIGPGSFTGIRIGVATALGFAQSLSIPFAGVSGLDALVHQYVFPDGHIGAVLDAHRSQIYYAEYVSRNGKIRQAKKPRLVYVSDLERELADRHLYIVGDLKDCRLERSRGTFLKGSLPNSDLFLAASIGRLAFSRKRIWRSGSSIVAEPMYIRPPDALKKKSGKR